MYIIFTYNPSDFEGLKSSVITWVVNAVDDQDGRSLGLESSVITWVVNDKHYHFGLIIGLESSVTT